MNQLNPKIFEFCTEKAENNFLNSNILRNLRHFFHKADHSST